MAHVNDSGKQDRRLNAQEALPVLPLRNAVVFPGMVLPLRVGRARSVAAVEAAMAKHGGTLVLVALKDDVDEPTGNELYKVGTLAHVESSCVALPARRSSRRKTRVIIYKRRFACGRKRRGPIHRSSKHS